MHAVAQAPTVVRCSSLGLVPLAVMVRWSYGRVAALCVGAAFARRTARIRWAARLALQLFDPPGEWRSS